MLNDFPEMQAREWLPWRMAGVALTADNRQLLLKGKAMGTVPRERDSHWTQIFGGILRRERATQEWAEVSRETQNTGLSKPEADHVSRVSSSVAVCLDHMLDSTSVASSCSEH